MTGNAIADLGIGPGIWLVLSLLMVVTVFFKFSRLWSVRNLDLVLLFVLAPGLLPLVGKTNAPLWWPYVWLFVGSAFLLVRCLLDLGLTRRPLLEPNLNAAGLACLAIGISGLMVVETVSLPVGEETARNPAEPRNKPGPGQTPPPKGANDRAVTQVIQQVPLPPALRREPPQVILARVLASLGHLALVAGLLAVGRWHFERPISGLAVATCYLILPYTRIMLVDSSQLIPAALIVWAVALYTRPATAGLLIGLASGWLPACLGLVPLWTGFYRKRGGLTFAGAALGIVAACLLLGRETEGLGGWARALGARSLAVAGLLPGVESPKFGSFWTNIDPAYRLPVQILFLALVILTAMWPAQKNLGELIALSAAVLVASQFWYLESGGTLILLYLPLILLMMFRPNLAAKLPVLRERKARATPRASVHGA